MLEGLRQPLESGDITISLAEVDLVHVSLRALISSVQTLVEP